MFRGNCCNSAGLTVRLPWGVVVCVWTCVVSIAGCGTTQQSTATQQLLESDAVDAAIAQVDFTPLAGRKIYFDTSYISDYKGIGFVNANYVISGIRQQVLAAGCELQDSKDTANVILEGRLGTLGSDEHNVVYGVPKNNAINSVSSAVPGSPTLPSIPELAIAKKVASQGAAKLALFAYDSESRQPVWQSGLAIARSSARDTWLLGAGPFQSGTIHRNKVRFAGRRLSWNVWAQPEGLGRGERFASYESGAVFHSPADMTVDTLLAGSPGEEPGQLAPSSDAAPIPISATSAIKQVSAEVAAEDSQPAVPVAAETPPTAETPVSDPAPDTSAAPAVDSATSPSEPLPFPMHAESAPLSDGTAATE